MRPTLVLLDRDGVLNEDSDAYIKSPAELIPIKGSAEAVARLNAAGIMTAIVSNQSAVGRGMIDAPMLARINDTLRAHLAKAGARIDLWLECTDPPWAASDRRKPGPGMLREALEHFRLRPQMAMMIGDTLTDMQAAKALGCGRVLVRTGKGAATLRGDLSGVMPLSVRDNLADAVEALLSAAG